MPGASYLISPTDVQIGRVTLEHLHMLDYDGEVCNGDENYDYYQCKHDHLFKVNSLHRLLIENFGPRTFWHCKIFALLWDISALGNVCPVDLLARGHYNSGIFWLRGHISMRTLHHLII